MKIVAQNSSLPKNFVILETFEAGLVLKGAEAKAAKAGQINLKGAYVTISPKAEASLVGAHISLYQKSHLPHYNPLRERKLLLHKKEIKSLLGKTKQKGLTLMPSKVYTKGGLVKLEVALVRHKKRWDKRQALQKKEATRRIQRALKTRFARSR